MKTKQLLMMLLIIVAGTTLLSAQASRTWVSGVGDDANPCSRTAPCKTFAGAISKTAVGGEIDALDPAGFGAVTITKAITIDGGGGPLVSVLVSGTNGIVVQAGASDVVILRNISINGIGTGINGIRFLSGKALIVENCQIFGFTTHGIDIALAVDGSTVSVKDTNITKVGGDGIRATTTVGRVSAELENVRVDLASGVGVHAANHARIMMHNSAVERSGTGGQTESANNDAQLAVDHCRIVHNTTGLTAGPGVAGVVVNDSDIAFTTGTAMNPTGGGIITSFGTNRLHNNGANGTFGTIPQQ
jgi:parallel beta helix pectate lyase-like protein